MRHLTDHEAIQHWVSARAGRPAIYDPPGGKRSLRLIFGQRSGAASNNENATEALDMVEWDQWFELFEERGFALEVGDKIDGTVDSSHTYIARD